MELLTSSWLVRKDELLAGPMRAFRNVAEERMRRHRENGTRPKIGLTWFYYFFVTHHFIPNAITIARMCLAPLLYYHLREGNNETAFFIFTTAALSDLIDGILARGFSNITKFGKIADPIADKLLTVAILFGLRENIPDVLFWSILLIATVLFVLTLLFILAKKIGIVLHREFGASSWGKYKFALECSGYALIFIHRFISAGTFDSIFYFSAIGFLSLSVLFGIISIFDYIASNISNHQNSYKT